MGTDREEGLRGGGTWRREGGHMGGKEGVEGGWGVLVGQWGGRRRGEL